MQPQPSSSPVNRLAEAIRAAEAAAKQRSVPLKIIRDTCDEGREQYQARLILIRPDQFVAWASSDSGADGAEILERAIGAGQQPAPSSALRP